VKKYLSSLVLVGVLLSGCGAGKVYNVAKPTVEQSCTKVQMKNAIVAALQHFRWLVIEDTDGKLVAEYRRGKIMAKIAITYTASSYEINYVDSENLKYDGENIHSKYNGWIRNLEKEIENNLAKIANGEKIYISSVVVPTSGATVDSVSTPDSDTKVSSVSTSASAAVITTNQTPEFSCKKTFNFTGSLWKGRVITAKQSINNISKEQAVVQAASVLSSEGFVVDTTSPNVGLISAHEVKSNGKTLPINLMFTEDDQSGVVAKLTVSVPAGESFSVGSMKNYMCNNVMGHIKSTGYVKKEEKSETTVQKVIPATTSKKDVPTRLKELRKLYDEKLITKKEYDTKREKILEDL